MLNVSLDWKQYNRSCGDDQRSSQFGVVYDANGQRTSEGVGSPSPPCDGRLPRIRASVNRFQPELCDVWARTPSSGGCGLQNSRRWTFYILRWLQHHAGESNACGIRFRMEASWSGCRKNEETVRLDSKTAEVSERTVGSVLQPTEVSRETTEVAKEVFTVSCQLYDIIAYVSIIGWLMNGDWHHRLW